MCEFMIISACMYLITMLSILLRQNETTPRFVISNEPDGPQDSFFSSSINDIFMNLLKNKNKLKFLIHIDSNNDV